MNFYFISEKNYCVKVEGTNKEIYDLVMQVTREQKTNSGFIGAIDDNNRVRASLLFSHVDRKVFTKLNGFIRKYAALGVLEKHAEMLKAASMG